MAEIGSAFVTVVPSAKGFGRKLDSQVGGDLDKSGKSGGRRFGTAFGGSMKGLIGPAIGLAAGAAAVSFLKGSVDEAREAQKVGAQTRAVIKSTGGAAKLSAKDFGTLATAISTKTGIDDEQIQAGENMLATFVNVRDEVGKNNDIFSQATKLSADLAVATGTDQVGANVLLGKALNDPAKGLSRLTRIGVTFSDQQKQQVQDMTKAGDTAGAQRVILKELAKEFGGSAEAQATAADKAKVAFGNLKESVGTALLPVIDKLATFATDKLIPALYQIPDYFKKLKAELKPAIDALLNAYDAIKAFAQGSGDASGKLQQVRDTISQFWNSLKSTFASGVSIVQSLWRAFGDSITQYLAATFTNVLMILRGAFRVIQGIFQVVSALLKGDWQGVWDGIKNIVAGAFGVIAGFVRQGFALLRYIFKNLGVILKAVFAEVWSSIKSGAAAGVSSVIGALKSAPGKVAGALSGLSAKVFSLATAAFGQLKAGAVAGVNTAVQFLKGVPKRVSNGVGDLGSILFNAGKALIQGLINGIKSMVGAVGSAAKSVANAVKPNFPGSPIKEGPLKSWNNGGAGKRLVDQGLIAGINSRRSALAAASSNLASSVNLSPSSLSPRMDASVSGASAAMAGAGASHRDFEAAVARGMNGATLHIQGLGNARLATAGA